MTGETRSRSYWGHVTCHTGALGCVLFGLVVKFPHRCRPEWNEFGRSIVGVEKQAIWHLPQEIGCIALGSSVFCPTLLPTLPAPCHGLPALGVGRHIGMPPETGRSCRHRTQSGHRSEIGQQTELSVRWPFPCKKVCLCAYRRVCRRGDSGIRTLLNLECAG